MGLSDGLYVGMREKKGSKITPRFLTETKKVPEYTEFGLRVSSSVLA